MRGIDCRIRLSPPGAAGRRCGPLRALACGFLALLALLLVCAPLRAVTAAGLPQASGFQVLPQGERTRVLIELDRPVAFRTFAIPNPLRLVIDLPEVDWRVRPRLALRPGGLITGEQHGLFSRGRFRLVLDVAAPFTITAQAMLPPEPGSRRFRLFVDLEPQAPLPPRPPAVVARAPDRTRMAPPSSPPPAATAAAKAPLVAALPAGPPAPAVPLPRPRAVPPPPPAELPPMLAQAEVPPSPPSPAPEPAAMTAAPSPPPPAQAPAPEIVSAALPPPSLPPLLETPRPAPVLPPPAPEPPALALAPPVIVIDPGHGGIDPGTVGVDGQLEKTVVLQVALVLRDLLEATGRYQAVLTRDGDTFLRLRERIALAREAGGSLFISLHADAIGTATHRGVSVYTLSETASDAEAGRLASKENKSDILSSTDLSHHDPVVTSILIDLAQRETKNRSIAFAELLAEELGQVAPLVHRHQRFAGFAVLKSPDIPSVLIELGYLSNPEDAHNLSQPGYRAALAGAVLRALDRQLASAGL